MKRRILAILCMLAVLCACCAFPVTAFDLRGFMTTEFYTVEGRDVALPYRIYLPHGLTWQDGAYMGDANKSYTLLLWLHDEDLRGDDNTAHISDEGKNVLLSEAMTRMGERCIVIAPQCPMGETWESVAYALNALLYTVRDAMQAGGIYEDTRVLLGGIGMGATYGYTFIGTKQDALPIDAAFLIGGTCTALRSHASAFAGTTTYAFVSANDADNVRTFADAVNQKADGAFTATEYAGADNELWLPAFAEESMIAAFLGADAPPEEDTSEVPTEEVTEEVTEAVTEDKDQGVNTTVQGEKDTEDTQKADDDSLASNVPHMQIILIIAAVVLVIALISVMRRDETAKKKKNGKKKRK